MLSQALKEHTAQAHRAAEKKMVAVLKGIRGLDDYAALLSRLHGFYAPVEALIRCQLTEFDLPDIRRRIRAPFLLRDIGETGVALQPVPPCNDLPRIDSYPRALGALYVLEGSTLGGQVIAGMLARQLEAEKSLSFFHSYGEETDDMWQTFLTYLERPFTAAERREIIAAAEETFLTFSNWIDQHELQPQL